MTQNDMTTLIAQRCGVSRELAHETFVDLMAAIAGELDAGGRVHLPGIGNLVAVPTAARQSRNPRTGERLPDIPAGHKIKFTPAKAMKERLGARAP